MYDQIKVHNEGLFSQLGISVGLADSAIDEITRIAIVQDRDISEVCLKLANELEYGLKLVRDRIGFETFTITREAVLDPEKYIDSLIKKYYNQDPATS
jgi:ATP-dependent Clp protease ATP-binding subunit ClpX